MPGLWLPSGLTKRSSGVEGWPYYLLQFQVHATSRRAELSLYLTWQGDGELKRRILEGLSEHGELFTVELPSLADDSIDLGICNILEETDYETWWDEDKTRGTISSRLEEFARNQFPEINRTVLNCLEQYRAEVT